MTRGRRLLVPALSTLIMLVVLCALGVWQVHRLGWKTTLLARIAAAEAAPGVALPAQPLPYQKVRVEGTLRARPVARYGVELRDAPQGQILGSQVAALLDRPGAPPLVTLLGWAPDGWTVPLPTGPVTLQGYVRQPVRPGLFSAADDPTRRVFYTLDPAAIGRALGAGGVAPFVLVVLGSPRPGEYPAPAAEMPRPPNNHLQYALTWFGLAAALLVIFALYVRKVLTA